MITHDKSWEDMSSLIAKLAEPYMESLQPNMIKSESPFNNTDSVTQPKFNNFPSLNSDLGQVKEQSPKDTYCYTPVVSRISGYSDDLNIDKIRSDFPILSKEINGKQLIWFDNGATTHKPSQVINRISYFYENENSNVHRGAHALAQKATDAYENARNITARFINAPSSDNIIFVRGTTEAINLVASTYGNANVDEGDEIIVSQMEHHANIVPWQLLCQRKSAILKVIPVDHNGQLIMEVFEQLLSDKTKIVALTQVSNVLGTVTPVKKIVQLAHSYGAKVLIDGAQSVAHMPIDIKELDADFFAFSGHKIYAPTGIGVLYGKQELLDKMPPYQSGGNMILDVTFERTLYHDSPARFEAGTGSIADAVGLGAALEYVSTIGIEKINAYEQQLLSYGTNALQKIDKINIIGNSPEKSGVFSFIIDGISNEKIGNALKQEGFAVRIGHHCAQPVHRRFGLEETVRAVMGLYNTKEEIDHFVETLMGIK